MENDDILQALKQLVSLNADILTLLRKHYSQKQRDETGVPFLEDLIDGTKVREILDIGESTLYRLKKRNLINTYRIGYRDYFSRTEIEKVAPFFMK
jgi:hypothetical protein